MTEPRMPSRTRLTRPDCWRSGATGRLRPDVRDLYFGLSTVADDDGWLLWRPGDLAVTLYPFDGPKARDRVFATRAAALQEAGLIVLHECGCAYLPRLVTDLKTKSGNQTSVISQFHASEHKSGPVRTSPDKSVSVSVSDSSSVSDSVSVAREKGNRSDDGESERSWDRFSSSKWQPLREALAARGFRYAPAGDPDEPGTQANVIWEIVDAGPDRAAEWVRQAPRGDAFSVFGFVIGQWREAKAGVPPDPEPARRAATNGGLTHILEARS